LLKQGTVSLQQSLAIANQHVALQRNLSVALTCQTIELGSNQAFTSVISLCVSGRWGNWRNVAPYALTEMLCTWHQGGSVKTQR
jgi:hypothetical protein